ncbi:MAG: DoxX family membrane protein [Flammeovirgaceae bacterium]
MKSFPKLSGAQASALVVLRVLIGWHFLYEGVIKLYSSTWSAKSYLLNASFLTPFFRWLASESVLPAIDVLNIAALMVVGISLLIGFRTKWASVIGIGLLLLYFLAHPPFPGLPQGPSEGSYWLVNKNLIEAAALWVLFLFPTDTAFGIEHLFEKNDNGNSEN